MKKFPWGISAGICAMIWSLAFIGICAVYIISSLMYTEVGGDDGLREAWWLVPLYIGQLAAALGCGVSLFFYGTKKN